MKLDYQKNAIYPSSSTTVGGVWNGTIAGGSGYTNGNYLNVPLTGGSGEEARADISVSAGAVDSVTLTDVGYNYAVGDVLSAASADIGGTGTGFTFTVTHIQIGNITYKAGDAPTPNTNERTGGDLILAAGTSQEPAAGTGVAGPGNVTIRGGAFTDTGGSGVGGGTVAIVGGAYADDGGGGNGFGGSINLTGGGADTGNGGGIQLIGGSPTVMGQGGGIGLTAGSAFGGNNQGGGIDFSAGGGTGVSGGGSVTLSAGAGGTVLAFSLAHFDGADTATTYIDDANGQTWAAVGGAELDTAQFKFGTASLLMDTSGEHFIVNGAANFRETGTESFTLQFWARYNGATPNSRVNLYSGPNQTGVYVAAIQFTSTTVQAFLRDSSSTIVYNSGTVGITMAADTWYHFALVYNGLAGGTGELFFDGNSVDGPTALSNNEVMSVISVDADYNTATGPSVWIDEIRFSPSTDYTGTYTEPTSALSATVIGSAGGANITFLSGGNGVGGGVTLAAGSGTSGAGGGLTLDAGSATEGNNTGGAVTITAGDSVGTANGVDVTITGGQAVTGNGGDINITSGANNSSSASSGSVFITTGTNAGSNGTGSVQIQTANATGQAGAIVVLPGTSGGSNSGSTVAITAGQGGATNGGGGQVTISGGTAVGTGSGGTVEIGAAPGGGGNAAGGLMDIYAGNGTGSGAGGTASFAAGNADTTGVGGSVLINAGQGGSTSGNAGTIQLVPGAATSGNDGDVLAANPALNSASRNGGFLYIPVSNGPPTGTPVGYGAGNALAMVYDTTTDELYVFRAGTWRSVALT